MSEKVSEQSVFEVFPVGYVRRDDEGTYLEVLEPYVPALKELDRFSHAQVLWWFSQFDDEMYRSVMQTDHAPYDAPTLGVFACRGPTRPNPIALTTVKMLGIDHAEGVVDIVNTCPRPEAVHPKQRPGEGRAGRRMGGRLARVAAGRGVGTRRLIPSWSLPPAAISPATSARGRIG
jgi:hypothetical protein